MVELQPSGYNDLGGEMLEELDARHTELGGYLGLRGATVEERMDLRCSELEGNLDLFDAEVGRLYGWNLAVDRKLDMARSTVDSGVMLRSASIDSTLHAYDADIGGDVDLKRAEVGDVNLRDARLETLKLEETDTYVID
ncbi:MAG: hypothetical protein SVU32_08735, partial [Candidatus Nanohaloarchaea archaeon]|nr:hypothetical protein [Candidatus Nanohaloarchaea archaeon]